MGPYQRPVIAMSGATSITASNSAATGALLSDTIAPAGAASTCKTGSDGTEADPASSNTSGWWNGLLCSTGHTSWWSTSVNANTSWTIEVTALDEAGAATVQKAQPVIGVWNAADPTGTQPTVNSETVALNSMALGVTQLRMPSMASASTLRIAIADQFGAGRPDFAYTA